MGKRKIIPVIGPGNALTNSIHHGDLPEVVRSFLYTAPQVVEVGGPEVDTRKEMAAMIAKKNGGHGNPCFHMAGKTGKPTP